MSESQITQIARIIAFGILGALTYVSVCVYLYVAKTINRRKEDNTLKSGIRVYPRFRQTRITNLMPMVRLGNCIIGIKLAYKICVYDTPFAPLGL